MTIADGLQTKNIAHAVDLLKAGALLAFATETVYGLGADAMQTQAVAKIYAAKGRPSDHPLIVHIASAAQCSYFCPPLPAYAEALAAAFWPGPLTLILPRRNGIASAAAADQASIGLRCPSHPVAQALLHAALQAGIKGIAAPSANRFGRISPTCAEHVETEFITEFATEPGTEPLRPSANLYILDGGPCTLGIESTIIDCTQDRPILLRPGTLTRHSIETACGMPLDTPKATSPKAPGTLASHYAPSARLRLIDPSTSTQLSPNPPPGVALYHLPSNPAQAAHNLFSDLRALDAKQPQEIWVLLPANTPNQEWEGVLDRLRRAAY